MKTLLSRFKKIYEEETGLRVSWNKMDNNENLTVGIVNDEGKELFWLHVKEENNAIIWY